ncbi:MAG: hypothetical protein HUJ80_06185 [Firmicutes bacterium]|nr:hypothetical protein [Bacillota bacterium]
MTWEEFTIYQRWDEFPERATDPPMTVDFAFWYGEKLYYCTGEDFGNILVDADWNRIAYNVNFLLLLEMPVFDGRSFRECINDILFAE